MRVFLSPYLSWHSAKEQIRCFGIISFPWNIKIRGGSRTATTSETERFVIIVNGFQSLTIITKRSILDAAAVLDPPLKILSDGKISTLWLFSKYPKAIDYWSSAVNLSIKPEKAPSRTQCFTNKEVIGITCNYESHWH